VPSNTHLLPLLDEGDDYVVRTPRTVRAVRIEGDPVRAYTDKGPIDVKPGQWLVEVKGLGYEVWENETFLQDFMPATAADTATAIQPGDDDWPDPLDDLVEAANGGDGGRG